MLKQFYEKALPTQGVYCITSIGTDKKVSNKFAETLDDVFAQIETFKKKGVNTFVHIFDIFICGQRFPLARSSLSALAMTHTELMLMAAPAKIGLSDRPKTG